MSIVSSTITRNHNRGDGSKSITEQHTDHNGTVHEYKYTSPVAFNVNTALTSNAIRLAAQLISDERQQVRHQVETGQDPANINVNYLTVDQKIAAVTRAVMSSSSEQVIAGAEFLQAIPNSKFNSLFGGSLRADIRTRINTVIANKAAITTDRAQRKEI